jgi:hypothetical protein
MQLPLSAELEVGQRTLALPLMKALPRRQTSHVLWRFTWYMKRRCRWMTHALFENCLLVISARPGKGRSQRIDTDKERGREATDTTSFTLPTIRPRSSKTRDTRSALNESVAVRTYQIEITIPG